MPLNDTAKFALLTPFCNLQEAVTIHFPELGRFIETAFSTPDATLIAPVLKLYVPITDIDDELADTVLFVVCVIVSKPSHRLY